MEEQGIELGGRVFSWRGNLEGAAAASNDIPIIVALHGGTYTSAYFDVPGHSLLHRALAVDIPILALDRPGYGRTPLLEPGEASHAGNAEVLDLAISELWRGHGAGRPGVVLIGHSIGGGIALRIAARRPRWPLLGVAVSGIGLRNAPGGADIRARLPDTPFIEMPQAVKDRQMFGPEATFELSAQAASHAADAPAPREELIDISSTWPNEATDILARIEAPVHYRQAVHDALWTVSPADVQAFGAACSSARRVDAALVENAGHCIDLHRAGPVLHLQQLAFALQAGLDRRFPREQGAPANAPQHRPT